MPFFAIFSDEYVFPILQVGIILYSGFALFKKKFRSKNKHSSTISVKRGEFSWGSLTMAYGFMALMLLEMINTTEYLIGYKSIITIIYLSALIYLCFFNGWSRNKIIGIVSTWKSVELNAKSTSALGRTSRY